MDGGECARDELLSECVGSVRDAVFGYIDRFVIPFEFDERLVYGFGREFPSEIRLSFVRIFSETVVDDVAIVVIEADEILMTFDMIQEIGIPKIIGDGFEEAIDDGRSRHFENDLVFGDADLGFWEFFPDDPMREFMRADEIVYGAEE